jgi:hypothetical protein
MGDLKTPQGSIAPEDLANELEKLQKEASTKSSLFVVKSGNEWLEDAKKRPSPKALFGPLWYQNELCILYADTNLGKSILAVQVGDGISKGRSILGFDVETPKQPVLYFDFELTDKQFENRCSDGFENHYTFDPGFLRVEINPDADIPNGVSFEDFLNQELEASIKKTGAKVLIIDNLTYLKDGTEKSKDALPLMKHLKALKSKYGLSILALAHTPKRDLSKPITRNDLSGSKMLINFCDSAFTIGESHQDKSLRYLKQIKARHTEIIYDSENVITCQIEKAVNFLQFVFVCYDSERKHLKQLSDKEAENLDSQIIELHNQGKSHREIAKELGLGNHMKAKRAIDKFKRNEQA